MFSTLSQGLSGFKNYFGKACYYSQTTLGPLPEYYITGAFTGGSLGWKILLDPMIGLVNWGGKHFPFVRCYGTMGVLEGVRDLRDRVVEFDDMYSWTLVVTLLPYEEFPDCEAGCAHTVLDHQQSA
jgi:hypothetical protein